MSDRELWRTILDHPAVGSSLRALCAAAVESRIRIGGGWTPESLHRKVIALLGKDDYGSAASLLAVLILWSEHDWEGSPPLCPNPTYVDALANPPPDEPDE